jgi:hypothetical protein
VTSPIWPKVKAASALSDRPRKAVDEMPVICVALSAFKSVEVSALTCVPASAPICEVVNAATSVVVKLAKTVTVCAANCAGVR